MSFFDPLRRIYSLEGRAERRFGRAAVYAGTLMMLTSVASAAYVVHDVDQPQAQREGVEGEFIASALGIGTFMVGRSLLIWGGGAEQEGEDISNLQRRG